MRKPGKNIFGNIASVVLAVFLFGCGDSSPDLETEPTFDDSPLSFQVLAVGQELRFSWDAVGDATQYRLTQTAGDMEVIEGGVILLEDLSVAVDVTEQLIAVSGSQEFLDELEFSLEALDPVNGWQQIAVQDGDGNAIVGVEIIFEWNPFIYENVTQYRLRQTAGSQPIIVGDLLVDNANTISFDISDLASEVKERTELASFAAEYAFVLEANVGAAAEGAGALADEWEEIPLNQGFGWSLSVENYLSPLRVISDFPSQSRTIAFSWAPAEGAEQYRLTQTRGSYSILPADQVLYEPSQTVDRFEVPVHLFDWGGSRFSVEALVDGEWQLLGQQDTAGLSALSIQQFTQFDAYAPSAQFRSQLAFGYRMAFSEDGARLAVAAIGDTSIPEDQAAREDIDGATIRSLELAFAWDEVPGATLYRLKQSAGSDTATIIADELEVEGLSQSVFLSDPDLDVSTLEFSLEANIAEDEWQEVPRGAGFDWEYLPTVVAARNAGAVFVYDMETVRSVKVKSPRLDAEEAFGSAIAISDDGETLVVAAIGESSDVAGVQAAPDLALDNNNVAAAGAVYVYTLVGDEWVLQAYIKAPVIQPEPEENVSSDRFGWSVALSGDGNRLAIGSIGEDSDGSGPENDAKTDSGAVFVYSRVDGVWAEEAYLKASNADENDQFGLSVAMSSDGNYIAVWAPGESGNNGDSPDSNGKRGSGAVYVYARDELNVTWTETDYLKASNAGAGDRFGQSLSFDATGSLLVVGAPGEDHGGSGVTAVNSGPNLSDSGIGAAYLFERSGAGTTSNWTQKNFYFKASNPNPAANFGVSVVMSSAGDYIAIGAWGDSSLASGINGNQNGNTWVGAGAAYVFKRQGSNDSWQQVSFVKPTFPSRYEFFGSWLDMARNGELLGVSATSLGARQLITGQPGIVYIY